MSKVVKSVTSIFTGDDKKPEPAPATAAATELAGPQNKDVEARAADFATREQVVGQRAAAAGATRSDNDADLLGYVTPKRRAASRLLLG